MLLLALTPNSRLGVYEVSTAIGAGGMGQVYRARDTRLNRDVALKVLPDSFAADPDRLARFTREAQTLAALNHPNIAHIHGLEESGGVRALVLELVEGEDLSQRLDGLKARGDRLPIDEALAIARQIADALEAAHEQGVVHRDLKPANVKVRGDGVVKVLDFGLAKALDGDASRAQPDAMNSPTLTVHATLQGVILGTAAYMAPEQARGKVVDKRADIWAFGVVLYEMLAGRRAFDGEEISDVLAAVLRQDVDWTALPADTPPRLRRLLERCLERNVKDRLRDIGEARVEIAKIESGAADSAIARPVAPVPRQARRAEFFAWGVAGMAALAALAALAVGVPRASPASAAAARVLRLWFVPALSRTLSEVDDTVVSPNGQLLLFSARGQDGRRVLWLRALDSLEPQPLPDTEDPIEPFWSPDSRSIAFGAHGKLRRFDLGEARAQTLTDAGRLNSGSWSPSGVIVFSPDYGAGLMRVAATGGERAPATRLGVTRGDVGGHRYPVFLPDGRHFLYWAQRAVRVGDLDSANTKELLADFGPAVYAPPGWLLYIRNGIVVAHRFDATRLELSGDPMPVATVPNSINNPVRQRLSASTNGTLVVPNGNPYDYQLAWFDRSGRSLGAAGPMRTVIVEELPQISPDGAHVLVQRRDMQTASQNLWLGDLARGTYDRFTTDRGFEQMAMWSHDGRRVFCSTSRNGVNGIYAIPVAGGPDELLLQGTVFPGDVSPDGRWLFYMRRGETTRLDIWVLPLTGSDRAPHVLINSEFDEHQPQISPDGQWIAYTSDVTGTREVYVRRFTDGTVADATLVSAAGGQQPRWSRDGRELFYVNAARGFLQAQVTALPVTRSGGSVAFGAPAPLFKVSMFPSNSLNRDYDLSPDGQRFLIGTASEGDRVAPATLVLNWTAALQK